jgi:prepilin-type N-terminal cleavage/methylation domain-containing protein
MRGFTLLELLIVIGILAVLAAIGSGFYINYVRDSEVNSTADNIISDLKSTQAKSITGEDGRKWGIRFINGADDYYEIFSTPTDYSDPAKTIQSTIYLPGSAYFTQPAELSNSTVIFDKIKGTTASSASITVSSFSNKTKTANITTVGNIY